MRLGAAPEDALVEHREEVVEERAVRVEELVEEDELGLGEHARRARRDRPLAEARQVDRSEDLVRLGEAREEVLEVAPLHGLGERADERRLRRPRGPVEEQVLAGDDGDGHEIADLVASHVAPLERLHDLAPEALDGVAHVLAPARSSRRSARPG